MSAMTASDSTQTAGGRTTGGERNAFAGIDRTGKLIYGFLRRIPTWVLWLIVIVWSLPAGSLFVNSFRTRDAQRDSGWWESFYEGGWTLSNYTEVLGAEQSGGLARALINSFAIAIPATVIPVAIAAMAAYAFAWMKFRGREWLFIGLVSLLALPNQVALIPLLQLYSGGAHWTIPGTEFTLTLFPDFDLAGQAIAVWLTHTAFALPFAVFLLHNYISSLPGELFEAARIDGANHVTIFWRLVVPLSVPALAAFTIFQFLWTWNDYLVAITMIGGNGEAWPATIRIASMAGEFGVREHVLSAGAFIQAGVPLIVFFALQRFFVRGLLAGSVKS
ncbi:carbohydrate ABC transporter permease [Candidatus Poriferisodalis sp.]|uniref:carbohydrate ABC transporter permease n=1 Tax=Candidatus Poriferisodalis sp. TaxID=3101277 RepID=UPI003B017995